MCAHHRNAVQNQPSTASTQREQNETRARSCQSVAFPPASVDWARLVPLIGRANAALARYDGLVASMPNPTVLLSPLTTQEAVLSSKIEGTVVTMGKALQIEAGAGQDLG